MGRRRRNRRDLPERVYFRHGAFYFVTRDGRWQRLGKALPEALAKYAEIRDAGLPARTMGQVFDRYQAEVVPTKRPRTQQDNVRELANLRRAFGHMPPDDITPRDIYAYMDARGAPVRANREKALLSHVFSYAIRWGLASDNPCRLVKTNPEHPRNRYVTDEEFQAVYELAPPTIRGVMLLAVITGLRQSDILGLRLQDVTGQGLLVETAKTQKRLLFEWTPALAEAIGQLKAVERPVASVYLVPNRDGQRYTPSGFKANWSRLMRRALAQGAIHERFTFHDLRAKAGSESEDERLLGHQDTRTLRRHYQRAPVRVTPITPKILEK